MWTHINLYQCVMYVNSMEWRIFSFVKPSSFAIFIALDRKFANYFGFRHHTENLAYIQCTDSSLIATAVNFLLAAYKSPNF